MNIVDSVISDSNDSDIFIVEHIKPSFQKFESINSSIGKKETEVKKRKVRKYSSDSHEIKSKKRKHYSSPNKAISNRTSGTAKSISEKKCQLLISDMIFSNKAKTSCAENLESSVELNVNFHPVTSENFAETKTDKIESPTKTLMSCNKTENFELSPGIKKKRKHFKIKDSSPNKEEKVQKSLFESFNVLKGSYTENKEKLHRKEIILNTDKKNEKNEIKFEDDSLFDDEFENHILLKECKTKADVKEVEDQNMGNSTFLCTLFKKIIADERRKQNDLQQLSLKNGIKAEKLFLECECEIYDKFLRLDEKASKLFVRILGRKKYWHRVSNINYVDIGDNLETEFEILKMKNFVDTRIEVEDLKTQMALLSKSEVLNLWKELNIPVKFANKNKKENLINSLIENFKTHKSVYDMLKKKNSRLEYLKNKVNNCLGMCIRINDEVFRALNKLFVLVSFAHYFDEEEKRFQNELFLHYQVHKNMIKFPNYKTSPTLVFVTLEDFEEYEKSLLLQGFIETVISNKNYDKFVSTFNEAKVEFKKLLNNDEYVKRFLTLEPFLKRFSAGTVYAKILTKCCKTFKRKADISVIVNTVQLLLGQNVFLTGKRGEWYEILCKALENQKQNNNAAEVLIDALKDPLINEVQKLTLQLRGQSILKKKTEGIKNVQLRELLVDMCVLSVYEPSSIEIKGKALEGNESGFKAVYIQEFNNKTLYSSVEERAISHYKLNGYTKGYHLEGFIVQTLYFLFFFDIIYDLSPHGVFQSPYQEAPLDLYSASFYKNRKEPIDFLLNDMLNWSDEQVKSKINDTYYKNYKTICVIKWIDEFTPDLFFEIIKCISMPKLILIFQRFLKSFRVSRSGFPDLTLWNPVTNKCKFVEVKSPSDKLSPAQRLWLDYLRSIELDCEVCNIKNISSKKLL